MFRGGEEATTCVSFGGVELELTLPGEMNPHLGVLALFSRARDFDNDISTTLFGGSFVRMFPFYYLWIDVLLPCTFFRMLRCVDQTL